MIERYLPQARSLRGKGNRQEAERIPSGRCNKERDDEESDNQQEDVSKRRRRRR